MQTETNIQPIRSTAAAKPNRRKAAQERNRTAVIDAAKALFERDGYEAATIRQIAQAAKLSTGAVFSNFADKAELYEKIVGHAPITAEQGKQMAAALIRAEAFVAGFEGAPLQDGIDQLLAEMRAAIACVAAATEQPRPFQVAA